MIALHRPSDSSDRPTRTSSLRLRVVLGVSMVLVVVLFGLGATVNAILANRLRSDLYQHLADRAGLAQALGAQGFSGQQLLNKISDNSVTAREHTATGTLTGVPDPQPPRPGTAGRPPKPPAAPGVVVQQNGEQLSSQVAVGGTFITLYADASDIDHTLRTLRGVELAAGAVTLIVAGLGLVWVVATALAPLDRMTTLARRIRDGARGRRLRPTRPGTELGRTAVAFDDMLDALETAEGQARAAEDRMRRFLADASHDLRTPVAGVIATAERILRENPDRTVRETHLVEVIREARRAARLVDDVVLISRFDATVADPARQESIDLADLVRRTLARRDVSSAPAVAVVTPESILVRGDADQLERAITNLLDNAERHGGGSPVDVSIMLDAGRVTLDVGDRGPGIPLPDRERVFERFVRLQEHRAGPGTGLGLPIARAIARAHGGDLRCEPRADGASGVSFRLTLPVVRPPAPSVPAIDAVPALV